MKKLLIIIFLISGCAHKQPYIIPPDLIPRIEQIKIEVLECIQPRNEIIFYIVNSKEPNAWLYEKGIYFTEGLFEFDDDTLKFIMAHEIAHDKLGHVEDRKAVSYVTTGAMLVLNAIIPGAGLLNWAVNPVVVNNFSKKQEFEADSEASRACLCLGISIKEQVEILRGLQKKTLEGGGFWDQHPSWDERVRNIEYE